MKYLKTKITALNSDCKRFLTTAFVSGAFFGRNDQEDAVITTQEGTLSSARTYHQFLTPKVSPRDKRFWKLNLEQALPAHQSDFAEYKLTLTLQRCLDVPSSTPFGGIQHKPCLQEFVSGNYQETKTERTSPLYNQGALYKNKQNIRVKALKQGSHFRDHLSRGPWYGPKRKRDKQVYSSLVSGTSTQGRGSATVTPRITSFSQAQKESFSRTKRFFSSSRSQWSAKLGSCCCLPLNIPIRTPGGGVFETRMERHITVGYTICTPLGRKEGRVWWWPKKQQHGPRLYEKNISTGGEVKRLITSQSIRLERITCGLLIQEGERTRTLCMFLSGNPSTTNPLLRFQTPFTLITFQLIPLLYRDPSSIWTAWTPYLEEQFFHSCYPKLEVLKKRNPSLDNSRHYLLEHFSLL